jgi:hypothetical protein
MVDGGDLSSFYMNNPTANENPGDFEPDGTPYSMMKTVNVDFM